MTADENRITLANGRLNVPDNPTIPYIEGDGTGPDIWRASVRVFDAAIEKAYKGRRRISWKEVLAGEKGARFFREGISEGVQKSPLRHNRRESRMAVAARIYWRPEARRHRAGRRGSEAHQLSRHGEAGAQRNRVRREVRPQERHAR